MSTQNLLMQSYIGHICTWFFSIVSFQMSLTLPAQTNLQPFPSWNQKFQKQLFPHPTFVTFSFHTTNQIQQFCQIIMTRRKMAKTKRLTNIWFSLCTSQKSMRALFSLITSRKEWKLLFFTFQWKVFTSRTYQTHSCWGLPPGKKGLINRYADVWLRFWSWCLVEIMKVKDQDLCKNLWYDLKRLLW